jgi:hypothetical protein
MFYLNGENIPVVSEVKHLGHILSNSNVNLVDVNHICGNFNKSVNIMMANFGSVSSAVLGNLFSSYCCNYYGITLCNLRSDVIVKFFTLWRKSVRRIYKLPWRTHNFLLPFIINKPPVNIDVEIRVCKFFTSMLQSPNILLCNLAKRCLYQTVSNMGKNVSLLRAKHNVSDVEFLF